MKTQFAKLLILLSLLPAYGATFVPQGKVEFKAKGFPTFITIKGTGAGLGGKIELEENQVKAAAITFSLKELKTGMDLRDEHMHDKYLETKKYPTATLTLPSFTLKDSGTVKGKLKLHNVEKEVEVSYSSNRSEGLEVDAEFQIILADYNIDIPSFQGITVAKDINLSVNLKANKEK